MTPHEAALENALMEQNDRILFTIDNATDAEALERASYMIALCSGPWIVSGYRYKKDEVVRMLKEKAQEIICSEESYLRGCRKNDRTRATTEAHIKRLELLAS